MKVSEAINKLEVGETVWVKGTVNEINYEGEYIKMETRNMYMYLDCCIKFTDKSKADAVALLVEGSVEEV